LYTLVSVNELSSILKCTWYILYSIICSHMPSHPSLAECVQPSWILSIWKGTSSCHSSKIRQRPLLPSTCLLIFAPAPSGLWHSSFMFFLQ
jgi:hypothetical protein